MRIRSPSPGLCRGVLSVVNAAAAIVITLTALLVATPVAQAQTYPSRTVKIIVPFPAGGTADAMPRILADWLSRRWGQAVIIENHSGAGGNVGAELAYKAESDGYTLFSAPPPPLAINQNLYPNLAFDPARFEPIIIMGQVPNALMVNPDRVAAKTVPDFIAYLKANPGKGTAATQGNGTTSHLTSEMFQMMAKVQIRNIPYRGSAPALQGLLAGDVDMMFDNIGVSMALIKSGKLRLLALATEHRLASMPDMPTVAETLPGFQSAAWYAVVAPPNTPKPIVEKLNADFNEALRAPEVQQRLKNLSAEIVGGSVEKTAKFMRAEVDRWKQVITAAHVKLE
ncbi:MAG TPA: tripartite tricarboxylate transporter substrate binding protein [Pseudolabrys sp.]|nr:tripartite tricarboxylate transporter substrate binding protein [Pseudolabrys sp.]